MLKLNQLNGFAISHQLKKVEIDLVHTQTFTADVTSHTTSTISLGNYPCWVVAVTGFDSAATFLDISSLSIGGSAAQNFTRGVQAGAVESAAGWQYFPDGGDITVNTVLSTGASVTGFTALLRIRNKGAGQFYDANGNGGGAFTIDLISGGVGVFFMYDSVGGDTLTWSSGITSIYSQQNLTPGRGCVNIGLIYPTATEVGKSVNCSGATNQNSQVGMTFY